MVVLMKTTLYLRASHGILSILCWLLLTVSLSLATQSDIDCLRSIKASLKDPNNYLGSSWNFDDNGIEGYICRFTGIECWHPDENQVISIRLSNMGLMGKFPVGIVGCSSMTSLDLSNNSIYGNIPKSISDVFRWAVNLDLSSNQLSGKIPVSLSNCSYLGTLTLSNNQLRGQIPMELGNLSRLKAFNVSGNRLSGPVPTFQNALVTDYGNNSGLCNGPTLPCCLAT